MQRLIVSSKYAWSRCILCNHPRKGQRGIGWWAIEIRLAMVDRALAASLVRWLLAVDARDAAGIGKSTERRQRPARLYVRGEERVGRLIPVDYSSVTNSSP